MSQHRRLTGRHRMTCRMPGGQQDFAAGCIDALPVCLTFVFLFFSIGAASRDGGFSTTQSMTMTLAIHAAPLQAFMAEAGTGLGLPSLLFAALVMNFRFLFMSSALAADFQRIPLWKAALSIPLLSVSTFTLVRSHAGGRENPYRYFLGCGISTLSVALLATTLGVHVPTGQLPWLGQMVDMVLPVHFTALVALAWPRSRPLLMTFAGFVLTPFAGRYLQAYHVIAVPLLLGSVMVMLEARRQRKTS